MNTWIRESELDEVKSQLATWSKEFPSTYTPEKQCEVSFTEKEFYTVAERVMNLERQNKENAKLKLSDFLLGDIIQYLMENDEVKSVLRVDDSHEYEIKSNFFHIHGSGENRIIIIY